jgi:ABC-type antimicrobial peptide transport system permease subunit
VYLALHWELLFPSILKPTASTYPLGEVYANLGYDPFVYTSLDWMLLVNVTLMVIGAGIIASIYPAIKALSNDPADALRIE